MLVGVHYTSIMETSMHLNQCLDFLNTKRERRGSDESQGRRRTYVEAVKLLNTDSSRVA